MTDLELLEALYMRDVEHKTFTPIAKRFKKSRAAMIGALYRINDDLARHPCEATKPENRDGGMPDRWWDVPAQRGKP